MIGSIRQLFARRSISMDRTTTYLWQGLEWLETRTLFSAAFDVTDLTALRADPAYSTVDGSDLSVAILDTGLYASHPDIQGNFLRFFDAVTNGQNALTDPGTAIASQAFDPAGEGHGTHVAGTVGSTNPAIGVATGTNLISVRVLQAEGDSTPQVDPLVAGLRWVLTNQSRYNIRVVNMSLGSNTNFNTIPNKDDVARVIDQLEARGVTVVAASGNSYGGYASLGTAYPSVFSTIAVANTWEDSGTAEEREQITLGQGDGPLYGVTDEDPEADQLSASSQRSTLDNQVAAPGTTIFSTWNGDGGLLYNTIAGTSMASPFVAGTVALMQDAAFTFGGRYLLPDEVLSIIKSTADTIIDRQDPGTTRFRLSTDSSGQLVQSGPVQDLPETGLSYRRVNVYHAVQRVRDVVTGGTDSNDPTDPGTRVGDVNNLISDATTIPSLNGLDEFDFTAEIGSDGNVPVGANDLDLYQIVLDSPGFPKFDLDAVGGGQAFDPYVRLFDASGSQITFEDNTLGGVYPTLDTAQKLSTPLAAGTYYLGVSAAPNITYNPNDATGIVAGSSVGDYKVTISLSNPDPNGVVQGAFAIDLTNPDVTKPNTDISANFISGSIGSDPNPLTADGTPRIDIGAEDVDFFSVVAPDTGRLTVDIDAFNVANPDGSVTSLSDAVDSYVSIYRENDDPSQPPIANGFSDDEIFGQLLDSKLTVDVTEGKRYFIAITTYQNRLFSITNPFDRQATDSSAIGSYTAYFSFDNGDVNGIANRSVDFAAADTDHNNQVLGTIGADNGTPLLSSATNGGNKDVDFFAYTPTQTGFVQVDASGTGDFDAAVGLWTLDEDLQLVSLGDTTNGPASIGLEITPDMVGLQLLVSVTGAGNQGFSPFANGSGNGGETGDYSLSIVQKNDQQFRSLTNNSIQNNTPETINVGEPLRRDIGRDGVIDVGANDLDIYRFDSPFSGTLTVRTDTSAEDSSDTFLRVFNSTGTEIASNNNASASTTASSVTFTVTSGQTYYFGVNGASDNAADYNPLTGANAADGSEGHYTITLTASDTDIPFLNVSDAAATESLGEDTQATFTVTLTAPAATAVTVGYATADGTATAGSDYASATGSLTFAPGETSKSVSVDVFGDFDAEDGESFSLNLSGASGAIIGDGEGTGSITNAAVTATPLTFGGRDAATFTDAAGNPVSLSLKGPGTGTVFFATAGGNASRLVLNDTTGATALTFKGTTDIADIIVNGSLKSLGSKTLDLSGRLRVAGSVPKVTFDDLIGATLSFGDGSITFAADQVTDTSISSTAAIKSMKVGQWLDTDSTPDEFTAPAISALAVKGLFQAGITTGALGKVTIGGAVSGSDIHADSIASFIAGTIADSTIFAGVSGETLPDSADDFTNPAGAILALTIKGKSPGSFSNTRIAAATIGKISLGTIASANGGVPFGVAALTVKAAAGTTDANGPFKVAKLDDPAGSIAAGDFVLRLL